MKDIERARELAETMVDIGKRMGKDVVALLTDMDQPLGKAVGNSLEVEEAINVLKGDGPADVVELTLELGAWMLKLGGKVRDVEEGRARIKVLIASGQGLERFKALIRYQGGDPRVVEDTNLLPIARRKRDIVAKGEGFISRIDAEEVGICAMLLGAGRTKVGETIDPTVGIVLHKKMGDRVGNGEPLAIVYYNDKERLEVITGRLDSAFLYSESPIERSALVQGVVR